MLYLVDGEHKQSSYTTVASNVVTAYNYHLVRSQAPNLASNKMDISGTKVR